MNKKLILGALSLLACALGVLCACAEDPFEPIAPAEHEHDYDTYNKCTICGEMQEFKELHFEEVVFSRYVDGTQYESYYSVTGIRSASGEIVIPPFYNGKPVLKIGENAFRNCVNLVSVTIPACITDIGDHAFSESGIKSINIPDSVYSFGTGMFDDCKSLKSVGFGNNLGNSYNGKYLGGFSGCDDLKEIHYRGDLIDWCELDDISNLMTASSENSTLSEEGITLYIGGKKIEGQLVIPQGVISVLPYAFYRCKDITSVFISDTVIDIGEAAFSSCRIESAFMSDSVNIIGEAAFRYCPITKVTISNSVTTIGKYAFAYTDFTSVTIPDSVMLIDDYAFENCWDLERVTIGNSVVTIGEGAFTFCKALTSILIPNSVSTIEDKAFYICDNLTNITLGNGLRYIGQHAFRSTRIGHESYQSGFLYIGNYLISRLNTIQTDNGHYNVKEGTIAIADGALSGCGEMLTSVTIPKSLLAIGEGAFKDCDISSVTFEEASDWLFGTVVYWRDELSDPTFAASAIKRGRGLRFDA